jgi:hypothetical protein
MRVPRAHDGEAIAELMVLLHGTLFPAFNLPMELPAQVAAVRARHGIRLRHRNILLKAGLRRFDDRPDASQRPHQTPREDNDDQRAAVDIAKRDRRRICEQCWRRNLSRRARRLGDASADWYSRLQSSRERCSSARVL